ncbi:VOC family protein [Propionibacteriaceae bacterium Y1923]|uniref:VOC family protein n=1 Tax=Aestuariimicrobium sp. Y1814 TaxID=3418742 RepID=UPI003C1BC201
MTLSSTISIQFPGNAAEAFTFYHEVFGGEVQILRYADFPPMGMEVEPPGEAVAHADLTAEGLHLVGGDAMDDSLPLAPSAYSIMLVPDTVDDGHVLAGKLAAGGEVVLPLEQAPWGDTYGQVRDRFGLLWEINVPGNQPG